MKSTEWEAAPVAAAAEAARASASALAAAAPVRSEPRAERGGGTGEAAAEAGLDDDDDDGPCLASVGPHARIPKPRSPPPTPPRKKRSLMEDEGGVEEAVAVDVEGLAPPPRPLATPPPPPLPPPQGRSTPASAVSSRQQPSESLRKTLAATCCLTWRTRLELTEEEGPLEPPLASAAPTPATSTENLAAAPSSPHPSPTVPPALLVYLTADLSELPAWDLTEAEALRVASARERHVAS